MFTPGTLFTPATNLNDPDLYVAYNFDDLNGSDNAIDLSNNDRTGVPVSGSIADLQVTGFDRQAIEMNSTNVEISNTLSVDQTDFSVGFRLRVESTPSLATNTIYKLVDWSLGTNKNGSVGFYTQPADATDIRMSFRADFPVSQSILSSAGLSFGSWIYLTYVFEPNLVRFYLNGSLRTSTSRTGTMSLGSVRLLQQNNSKIDNFRIFTRALNAAEISSLVSEGVMGTI